MCNVPQSAVHTEQTLHSKPHNSRVPSLHSHDGRCTYGMQDYGFASDVYAFGIVLWEVSAMLSVILVT